MSIHPAEWSNALRCPYKGLIPYGEEDAPIFFGREKWCTIILDNLLASPLTLLYGSSGVGKSSVLQAGVVCRLRREAREKVAAGEPPGFAVIVCRDWRDDPLATLRARILEDVRDLISRPLEGATEEEGDLRALLKRCSQAIGRVDAEGKIMPGKLLLILDQFEEYFLYHPQETGALTFAEEFPVALNDPALSLNVLISLREDSLAKLDRFKTRIPNLFANRLQIDHLNRSDAIDAIRKPIEEFNRQLPADARKASVEPHLIQDVLEQVKVGQISAAGEEVSDQPSRSLPGSDEALRVETPFLQLVMMKLWEEESRVASPPRLRQQALARLGGAGTIVRDHLDQLMKALPDSSQRVAAVIFDKLVTSGLTKIAYPVFELTDPAKMERDQDLVDRQELTDLLEKLSSGSQRILRRLPPALDQPRAEERYEIFHDVLAKPILEWRRAYRQAAEREIERQQHAQELGLERQRRRRILRFSLGIGSLLLGASTFLLLKNQQLQAKANELKVIESAQQFKVQQLDQIDALVQAMEAAYALQQNGLKTSSGDASKIGASLRDILDNFSEVTKADLFSASDDAARVIRFRPDGSGVGILFQGNQFELRDLPNPAIGTRRSPRPPSPPAATSGRSILGFAFARQNGRLATVSSRGELLIWDGQGRMTHRVSGLDVKNVVPVRWRNRMDFSRNGTQLALIDGQDRLRIFDIDQSGPALTSRRLAFQDEQQTHPFRLVRFSPKGDVLATVNSQGKVLLFDTVSGRRHVAPNSQESSGFISSMEFADDGAMLAAASSEGVRLWQLDSQGRWQSSLLRAGRTWQLRFSRDGRFLATGSLDGSTRVWLVRPNLNPQAVASFLNQAPVQDVRFTLGSKTLLTVSTAGTLHEWKVPALPQAQGPARWVSALAFSSGGQWMAKSILGQRLGCLVQGPWGGDHRSTHAASSAASCLGTDLPFAASPSGGSPTTAMAQLAFNPQATLVAGLSWSDSGLVWNQQGQLTQVLTIPRNKASGPYSAISFRPDGQQFAVVARGGDVGILLSCPIRSDRQAHDCVPIELNPTDRSGGRLSVTSVRFLPQSQPSGSNLLVSSSDGQICFGDLGPKPVVNLRCQKVLVRPRNVWQLSVSPDGSRIGLAGFDGRLHLFRRRSGDHLVKVLQEPIKVSAGPLLDVSFSPQGGKLAAVSLDGTASLWDGEGRQLASFRGDEQRGGGFMKATFSADGSKLLLATIHGVPMVKNVEDVPMLLERGCKALASFLANPATDDGIRTRLSFCRS